MKKFISIILVLLMLISFSACGSFVVRGDSVYIKLYNGTGKNLKIITLDEYEDSVLKSTIVAENADKSSYRPGENLIFEVLFANPQSLSFVIETEDEHQNRYSSKAVSASEFCRGVIYAYYAEIAGSCLVLNYEGAES